MSYEALVISGKCPSVKLTVTYQVCGKQQVLRKRTHVLLGEMLTQPGVLAFLRAICKLHARGPQQGLWTEVVDELCRGEVGVLNRLEWSLRGKCWEGQPRCVSTVEGRALGVCSEVIRTDSMQDEIHKSSAAAPQSGKHLSQGLGEEARAVIDAADRVSTGDSSS